MIEGNRRAAAPDDGMPPHASTADAVVAALRSRASGLSDGEAKQRLNVHGPNSLRMPKGRSAWKILRDQLRSVVVALLLVASGISLFLGDVVDAVAIGAVLALNTALGFVMELRARRAMEALLHLQAPRTTVLRDGHLREIAAAELVPGDVIALEAGQSVPADGRVLATTDLRVDEAALTGESAPVVKDPRPVDARAPLADRASMVYQGTLVRTGSARAIIATTGMNTELGRIGALVGDVREERTPLERRLDDLGRRLVWIVLVAAAAVSALALLRGASLDTMLQIGIALAVAAVPEALPAVVTIALAVGVRRMARRKALIRRLPSAETLGSVTVICTDKTGTLTSGQMTMTVLALPDREIAIEGIGYATDGRLLAGGAPVDRDDAQVRDALSVGVLANHAEVGVDRDSGGPSVVGDTTEAALLVAGMKIGLRREHLLATARQIGEVPFSSETMFMATFHRRDEKTVACVKGAPVRVLEMCDRERARDGERALDQAARDRLLHQNRDLAARGLRVLALAGGPARTTDASALRGLAFLGLAGMIDPAASGVRETIRVFSEAGIRTVMITGDQRLTARAVARELGIMREGGDVLDGAEIDALAPPQLTERVGHVQTFSRVSPESKLAVIAALQSRGDVVAMLGDGVNDAPALRKADVGVAMGIRGTDVAKEAADVVLQDDRFATIGVAVEQGRVIFDNVRKFVFYLFSCNLAEILVLLIATALGMPLPLLPLQVLWLNLLTDTFPALSLAVEPPEENVMRRAPRKPDGAILSRRFLGAVAGYATMITAVTLLAFRIGLADGSADTSRGVTMSFLTLALAQSLHLGNARSRRPVWSFRGMLSNRVALAAVVFVVLLQVIAVQWPPLGRVLQTVPLSGQDWLLCLGLASVPAIVGQVLHATQRSRPGI
jgi:Ca2+-transporting ATPase